MFDIKSKFKNGYFVKEYPFSLFKNLDFVKHRTSLIKEFTESCPYTAPTYFTWDFTLKSLVRYSKKADIEKLSLDYKPRKTWKANPHLLEQLKETVTQMHAVGLVHGDLHPKNMGSSVDGNNLVIFDFEPDVEICFKGSMMLLASSGWIAPEDAKQKRLTEATDLFCIEKLS